jgi:hypothetical protein
MGLTTAETPEVYTGETEPRGARVWIPLTNEGRLIKSNVKRVLRYKPSTVWVYHQAAMDHLAEFDWPWSKLRFAKDVKPRGRWREYREFVPGVHDV